VVDHPPGTGKASGSNPDESTRLTTFVSFPRRLPAHSARRNPDESTSPQLDREATRVSVSSRLAATSFFGEATRPPDLSMGQSGYGGSVELTTVLGYLVFLFGLGVGLWLTYTSMSP
jgi:hypothetical protein